jgi:hypothetical protein
LSNIKPESLLWLDNLAAITAQLEKTPDATHAELGKALNIDRTMVTKLSAIKPCFDPSAIEKVRLAAKGDLPFILSYNSAKALSALQKAKTGGLAAFHDALDMVLAQRLATQQIKALVAWIASGKPASEFDPNAKPPKTTVETTEPETVESEPETEESTQQAKPQKSKNETLGQQIGSLIDQFFGPAGSVQKAPKTHSAKGKKKTSPSANKALGQPNRVVRRVASQQVKAIEKVAEWFAKIAWKELFKIEHRFCRKLAHVIVPLHTSHSSRRHHKSGSFQQGFITLFLTPLHWVVYVLLQYGFLFTVATVFVCPFMPALKPILVWPFRLAAHFAIYDFPAWVWACAQNHLGPTLIVGGLLAAGLYFAWKAEPLRISLLGMGLAYLIIQGRGWADTSWPWSNPVAGETSVVGVPTAVPEAVRSAQLESAKLKPKTSNSSLRTSNSTVQAYQPSISFQSPVSPSDSTSATTLYDPKLLEQEITALPQNCIVKSFPVLTDEGMPGDLAVSRLQDLIDPDKYTMMIGSGKQMIQSIAPSITNFTINYKSTDPFNLFNGPGQLNFFWEDVLYIHTDEITVLAKTPYKIYQLSLVVSGAKYALTIQCGRPDDLKHLVSTFEYFIRNSRLGHDTALAGMPYPSQGLVLNNDCVVDKLWAESPMDKAGMTLGDHLWSIGNVTAEKQSRHDLEAGLKTLPVTFFVASAAEWDRAMLARNPNLANSFRPRLRKIILNAI